jgi:hypothetical protein
MLSISTLWINGWIAFRTYATRPAMVPSPRSHGGAAGVQLARQLTGNSRQRTAAQPEKLP